MADKIIKPGYSITVSSWENDADNYQENTIDGLSKERVVFLIEFLELFRSKNNGGKKSYGNLYDPTDSEVLGCQQAVQEVLSKHRDVLDGYEIEMLEAPVEEIEVVELTYSYLGIASDDFYTRVFDRMKIHFVEHEIVMKDASSEF